MKKRSSLALQLALARVLDRSGKGGMRPHLLSSRHKNESSPRRYDHRRAILRGLERLQEAHGRPRP